MLTNQFFNLLLSLDENWNVQDVTVDDESEEILIQVTYVCSKAAEPASKAMRSIYDHAPQRKWRHLDTLQYKTNAPCLASKMKAG